MLKDYQSYQNGDPADSLTIRKFKQAIVSLDCLGEYSVSNLAKYMDRSNIGFISISEFNSKVLSAVEPGATLKSNKWSKSSN